MEDVSTKLKLVRWISNVRDNLGSPGDYPFCFKGQKAGKFQ